MSKVKQRVAPSQMDLPGMLSDEVAKTAQTSPPRQKSGSAGPKPPLAAILSLPPVKSFGSAEALRAAIDEVEPHLAALKGRLGSLAGAKWSDPAK